MNVMGFHMQVKVRSGGSRYLHCHYQSKGKSDMENGILLISYFLVRTRQ